MFVYLFALRHGYQQPQNNLMTRVGPNVAD